MDPVLEYILSNACGLLWLRPFMLGSYDRRFPRSWGQQCLSIYGKPPGAFHRGLVFLPQVNEIGGMGARWQNLGCLR
jgi:hypothetical protein